MIDYAISYQTLAISSFLINKLRSEELVYDESFCKLTKRLLFLFRNALLVISKKSRRGDGQTKCRQWQK
jgi:hypothetical protein